MSYADVTKNLFRSSSSLGLLSQKNDNSFKQATNLGILPRRGAFSFKINDAVGRSDPADFYKVQWQGGVNRIGHLRYKVGGGGIRLTGFAQLGNGPMRRVPMSPPVVRSGPSKTVDFRYVNPINQPITVYIKVTPLNGSSTYRLVATFPE